MGDLVLTETEIEPVMTKLLASGIDVTALHNHLLRANPATYYMHVHGHGDPVAIATAIRAALGESKTPFGPPVTPSAQAAQIDLDTAALDSDIGAKGRSMEASISSRFRARTRSLIAACRFHPR